jgi:hypothetical protein
LLLEPRKYKRAARTDERGDAVAAARRAVDEEAYLVRHGRLWEKKRRSNGGVASSRIHDVLADRFLASSLSRERESESPVVTNRRPAAPRSTTEAAPHHEQRRIGRRRCLRRYDVRGRREPVDREPHDDVGTGDNASVGRVCDCDGNRGRRRRRRQHRRLRVRCDTSADDADDEDGDETKG